MAFRIEPDEFYSPEEVAQRLGMSPRTLANWRTMGRGPEPTRVHGGNGARVWYAGRAVLRYLDEHTARWPSAVA